MKTSGYDQASRSTARHGDVGGRTANPFASQLTVLVALALLFADDEDDQQHPTDVAQK
jgi:hypothetical protein